MRNSNMYKNNYLNTFLCVAYFIFRELKKMKLMKYQKL